MNNHEIAKEMTALFRTLHKSALMEYSDETGFTMSATSAKQLRSMCFDLALALAKHADFTPRFSAASLVGKRYTIGVTLK